MPIGFSEMVETVIQEVKARAMAEVAVKELHEKNLALEKEVAELKKKLDVPDKPEAPPKKGS